MIRRFIFLLLFLISLIPSLFAEHVRYVIDGDTFILENNQRVRMIGIDAPEVANPKWGKQAEPFGPQSANFLRRLIQGKEVALEGGDEPYDKYGRRLSYVFLPDGRFINRVMVEMGYAETFRKFPFKYKQEFLELEKNARAQKIGMWAERPKSWGLQLKNWMSRFQKS